MPRKKAVLHLEQLQDNFHLPLKEAAERLGVCESILKKASRSYGIKRWPFRQTRALQKLQNKIAVQERLYPTRDDNNNGLLHRPETLPKFNLHVPMKPPTTPTARASHSEVPHQRSPSNIFGVCEDTSPMSSRRSVVKSPSNASLREESYSSAGSSPSSQSAPSFLPPESERLISSCPAFPCFPTLPLASQQIPPFASSGLGSRSPQHQGVAMGPVSARDAKRSLAAPRRVLSSDSVFVFENDDSYSNRESSSLSLPPLSPTSNSQESLSVNPQNLISFLPHRPQQPLTALKDFDSSFISQYAFSSSEKSCHLPRDICTKI